MVVESPHDDIQFYDDPPRFLLHVTGIPPASLRGNARGKWTSRVNDIREWKHKGWSYGIRVGRMLKDEHVPLPAVKITYGFAKKGGGDIDNFVLGGKSFLDGIVESGLLDDDSYHTVLHGSHCFIDGDIKKPSMLVEIQLIDKDDMESYCPFNYVPGITLKK